MRKCVILIFAVLVGQMLSAQDFEYSWQRVRMDSAYESDTVYGVDSIVAAHQEQMTPLMEVVIYSSEEIKEGRPESALSNLAADMLLYAVSDRLNNGYPSMSLTNFGGIRSNFPKGAVRVYDIYSTFPFDNTVVVAVMEGEDIRRILERFASGKFEALGGVEIVVRDGELEKCLIGGRPLKLRSSREVTQTHRYPFRLLARSPPPASSVDRSSSGPSAFAVMLGGG